MIGPTRLGAGGPRVQVKRPSPNPLASLFGASSFSDRQHDADDPSGGDPAKIPWNYGSPEDWSENYKARWARAAPWLVSWWAFCCAVVFLPQLPADVLLMIAVLAGLAAVTSLVLWRLRRSHVSRFISLGLSVHRPADGKTPNAGTR
jgi:hypothetical protein